MTPEAPKRIQRKRTKGWRMPDGAVYVGRPSKWGNPWTVGEWVNRTLSGAMLGGRVGAYDPDDDRGYEVEFPGFLTAKEAVALYRQDLQWGLTYSPAVREELAALTGKDLACWCPLGAPCHADVLLEIANR